MLSRTLTGSIAAGAVVIAVAIGACTAQQPSASSSPSGVPPSGAGAAGGGSNARSGPAEGGTAGTVGSASTSSFTVSTAAGQIVTVNVAFSTTYQNGTSSASPSAITTGETVLVLGMTNGTTITATQVIVQPAGDYGSAASSAAGVVPFQQGAQSPSKQVGQIPNYT